jgi:hypothetical protein
MIKQTNAPVTIVCGTSIFKSKDAKKYSKAIAEQLQHAIGERLDMDGKSVIVWVELTFRNKLGKRMKK